MGQRGRSLEPFVAGVVLDLLDFVEDGIERGGHELVHFGGVVALDEIGLVAVTAEQGVQFLVADAREDGGVGDLVAVEVQDGQDRAVVGRG